MIQFSIGLSALQAAQQGLAISGNNIANASTPGYHRQIAQLGTLAPTTVNGLALGNGVAVTDINRAVSDQLDSAYTQQLSQNSFVDQSLATSTQVEQAISSGLTSPATQLESLLNSLQSLSANVTSNTAQATAVSGASAVANAFNTAASDLSTIRRGLDDSISTIVSQINPLTKQIADLNQQISSFQNAGINPNDLLDTRGQLINNLSQLIGIQVQNGNNGQVTVMSSGVPLVVGTQADTLKAGFDKNGAATVTATGSDLQISTTGGQLGGLLSQRNNTLTDFQNRLDTLARQVATSFNNIQSTGLGVNGGFSQLTTKNSVADVTAPLNSAGLAFPTKAGSLFIGVTDNSTGQRTLAQIAIDPSTQSIQDVANAIGGVTHMQAFVNSQAGTMTVMADQGFTFDFAGGYQSSPTTTFSGTTTTPTIGGAYTGSSNDNYTVTFPTDGTIGITPGLQATVTESSGNNVATLNIGAGYQAGQPLTIANGVTVSLSAGDVTNGDSFSTPVIGNPDSAGLLNALGLNTLFTGNSAMSLRVNSDIVSDPSQLATSRTGQPADTTNLQRFLALSDTKLLDNGTKTFSSYANQMVSDIGSDVQTLTQQQTTNQTLTTNITTQQQSISGVDSNEELAKILQYQQMFAIAGKYISTVNDTISSLLSTI